MKVKDRQIGRYTNRLREREIKRKRPAKGETYAAKTNFHNHANIPVKEIKTSKKSEP